MQVRGFFENKTIVMVCWVYGTPKWHANLKFASYVVMPNKHTDKGYNLIHSFRCFNSSLFICNQTAFSKFWRKKIFLVIMGSHIPLLTIILNMTQSIGKSIKIFYKKNWFVVRMLDEGNRKHEYAKILFYHISIFNWAKGWLGFFLKYPL